MSGWLGWVRLVNWFRLVRIIAGWFKMDKQWFKLVRMVRMFLGWVRVVK